ncbi:asparagine synthase C-terminal domain-containing protein [Halopenitus sp. H-Gu1]|uniref:asparagine synthase C-terminal domain-containing protein n=1 Tax=Halopenitus sp. H-Gu1 TaxID=3242697 RepID=UPI00359E4AE7
MTDHDTDRRSAADRKRDRDSDRDSDRDPDRDPDRNSAPDSTPPVRGGDRLRGATAEVISDAIGASDPLPGGFGFAGRIRRPAGSDDELGEAALVRDVLGREPLFVEDECTVPTTDGAWAFDRRSLESPVPVPAGSLLTAAETRSIWTLRTDPDPIETAQAAVNAAVREAIGRADDQGPEGEDVAVAFSGGVDSALVASGVPDAPCYVAGFEGCHDLEAARQAIAAMDREDDLRIVEITHDDLTDAIPELVAATGRTNAMDLSIAIPLYLVARAAAADGHDRLLLGQGADELFGGYSKVVDPANDHRVEAETVRGARDETVRSLPDQLARDVPAIRAAGIEPVTPLLADRVVDAALRLPGELLATSDERKIALRTAAAGLVPDSVRAADKKALQYGTYVSRELDRLARQAGFKRRMDDHVGKYVASILEDADRDA